MLERLQSGRPFEVLNGPTFKIAVDEIVSKFPEELAKDKVALRCHAAIALGLKGAVDRGGEPQLRLRRVGDDSELLVVQIGRQLFPMLVGRLDWGNTAIELYPPGTAGELDLKEGAEKGIAGLYGQKKDRLDRLGVVRGNGPTTHLVVKGGDLVRDLSYAWALYEVASSVIRRAASAAPAKKQSMDWDPALGFEVPRPAQPTSDRRIVDALLTGEMGFAVQSNGPPLAHDLLAAFAYRGRTVAVTATKGDGEGIRVWVESDAGWRPLPVPQDASWPKDGATPVMVGDTIHFFGGVGEGAKVLPSYYTLDLSRIDDPSPDMFQKRPDLGSPMAWASAVSAGRDAFLGGGVAGFMVKAGEKREREKILRQSFALLGNNGSLRDRAPAPGDLTKSYAISSAGCLFFAPGDARDGKVRIYNDALDGGWLTLGLPIEVGLGQLFLADQKLYYAGGFTKNGKPSDLIFEADLAQPFPKFEEVGSSPYCAGAARLVERRGQLQALMIRPGVTASHVLEAKR